MEKESTVLLVEDDPDDVFFFQRSIEKSGFPYKIKVARNGLEAIDYMGGKGQYADRAQFPFPKFIVTDNRMPLVSGMEFLLWLRNHPQFHVVPTIILGGSVSQNHIDEAYQKLRVHSYIIKPSRPEELERIVELIFSYWAICKVPSYKMDS